MSLLSTVPWGQYIPTLPSDVLKKLKSRATIVLCLTQIPTCTVPPESPGTIVVILITTDTTCASLYREE